MFLHEIPSNLCKRRRVRNFGPSHPGEMAFGCRRASACPISATVESLKNAGRVESIQTYADGPRDHASAEEQETGCSMDISYPMNFGIGCFEQVCPVFPRQSIAPITSKVAGAVIGKLNIALSMPGHSMRNPTPQPRSRIKSDCVIFLSRTPLPVSRAVSIAGRRCPGRPALPQPSGGGTVP